MQNNTVAAVILNIVLVMLFAVSGYCDFVFYFISATSIDELSAGGVVDEYGWPGYGVKKGVFTLFGDLRKLE